MSKFTYFNNMVPASSPDHIEFIVSNGTNRVVIGTVDVFTGALHNMFEEIRPFHLCSISDYEEEIVELCRVYAMALLAMAQCAESHRKQAKRNGVI